VSDSPDFERVGDLLGSVEGPSQSPMIDAAAVLPPCDPAAELQRADPVQAAVRRPADDLRPNLSRDLPRLLAAVWLDVVGPEVAANARPVQLRRGRLVVSASSSAWAQTLQLMAEAIVVRLNERMGPGSVERAVFRHAGWEEQPRRLSGVEAPPTRSAGNRTAELAASPRVLTREQEEAVAAVEGLDVSPELREKMIRTLKAAFVRAEQEFVR